MKDFEPTDIGKHTNIIKAALKDMTETDVLVCGKCHSVFHFVELFKEHKDEGCDPESSMKDSKETKPKVWAFLLWKSAQLNAEEASNVNNWKLYQTWVKMDESLRDTWIIAGKTILSFNRMGQGNLREMPVKITKTVVDSSKTSPSPSSKFIQKASDLKTIIKKEHDDDEDSNLDTPRIIKKTISTVSPNKESNPLIINKAMSRRALRTIPKSGYQEFEDETVEKIIAKRFNPRRKFHEYLVKWEGLPHDQNTWEPKKHLESCSLILETFEKQLARQKEQRAAQAAKQAAAAAAEQQQQQQQQRQQQQQQQQHESSVGISSPLSSPALNRPARNSKAKALDQVKQWCADEENNSASSSVKRKLEDSDFDESTGGADDEDDFDEDDFPKQTAKRLKNGNFMTQLHSKTETKTDQKIAQTPKVIKAVNGPLRSTSSESSAEVVLTSDTQQSAIIRRPTSTTSHKNEAQIRVLSKGENASSGVVRITSPSSQTPKITQSSPTGTRITQVVQRNNSLSLGSNVGGQTSSAQQPKFTVTSKEIATKSSSNTSPKVVTTVINPSSMGTRIITTQSKPTAAKPSMGMQRSSLSPSTPTASQQTRTTSTISKPVVSRITKTSTPIASKPFSPEQKIIQLSKSGDLKVTRKVVNQTAPQKLSTPTISKQNIENEDETSQPETSLTEPASPDEMTLCPVTGKVFAQGESQPSPVPSPEPPPKKEETPQAQQQQQTNSNNRNENQVPSGGQKTQQLQQIQQPTQSQQNQQAQQVQQAQSPQTQTQQPQQTRQDQPTAAVLEHESNSIALGDEEHTQIIASEDGPLLVTGEDGTIYQVAGKNAEGQTILIAQGADGEQLAYVAADDGDEGVLSLGNNMAEVVAHMSPEEQQALAALGGGETQFIIKQSDEPGTSNSGATDATQALTLQTSDSGDSQDGNIPAEVVQADLPSPGGTRRVVLLLQDGTFMMTEMHDDEYQALNLAT